MLIPSDVPGASADAGRWRFRVYFAWSLAVCVVWLVLLLGGGRGYDPDRRPDLLDFALTVWSFVLIPALYGLFALVVLLRGAGRAGRGFFIGAVIIGVVATALALWFAVTFSGIDCRPNDCVAAVPDPGYYKAAYAVSLIPAVVVPLLLAVVRWPAAPSRPVRAGQDR